MKEKERAQGFLDIAIPALEAHERTTMLTEKKDLPEAIAALGWNTMWKRSPDEWEERVRNQTTTANETIAMAERFLLATTHVPCALYSLVEQTALWNINMRADTC